MARDPFAADAVSGVQEPVEAPAVEADAESLDAADAPVQEPSDAPAPQFTVTLKEDAGFEGDVALGIGGLDTENVKRPYLDEHGRLPVSTSPVTVDADVAALLEGNPHVDVEVSR